MKNIFLLCLTSPLLQAQITSSSFSSGTSYAVGPNAANINVFDADGDGKKELVVTNNKSDARYVSFFRNKVTSTGAAIDASSFDPSVNMATIGSYPLNIFSGDVDGDGKKDMLVSHSSGDTVLTLFKNIATGTTSTTTELFDTVSIPSSAYATAMVFGDLDGDGKPDIAHTHAITNGLQILLNTSTAGNFSFADSFYASAGANPSVLSMGDINNDNKPDLIIGSMTGYSIRQNTSTSGNISFLPKVDYTFSGVKDIAVADIDGDGKKDLVISAGNLISVFLNTSTSAGTLSLSASFDFAVAGSGKIAIQNLDSDGKPEIICSTGGSTISILQNTSTSGSISFNDHVDLNTSATGATMGIMAEDLNMDGRPEIIVVSKVLNQSGSVTVFENLIATSIHETNVVTDFSAYPNPVSDKLYYSFEIKNNAVISARITNALGEIVINVTQKELEGKNTFSIDTGKLANGIYCLGVYANNDLQSLKKISVVHE